MVSGPTQKISDAVTNPSMKRSRAACSPNVNSSEDVPAGTSAVALEACVPAGTFLERVLRSRASRGTPRRTAERRRGEPRPQPTPEAFESGLDIEQGTSYTAQQHSAEDDQHRC